MTTNHRRSGDSAAERTGTGAVANRRTFLKALGAGAAITTLGSVPATATPELTDFVETDGTEFVVDGQPIYFNGTNNFWITDNHATRARVDDLIELFDEMGLNVLRTWAHCEGEDGHCLQPELGVYSEEGLQHLDYVVAKAKAHGIRLIIALADNWDHDGGIPQYVEWIDGAEDRGDFYTMEACRDAYKNHVETILTRTNTITGIDYRDEPAIMLWELANEPRLEGDDTETIDDRQGVLTDWITEMSAFIKELDPNHLVSTGMEGFYTREGASEFFYNDWTGQDYIRHHDIDTIDACSFHMYPYHWDHPDPNDPDGGSPFPYEHGAEWIREHVTDAHDELGKPAYCGEFNVNRVSGLDARNDFLEEWYDLFDEYDIGAPLPWQVVLESTNDHDGFQLYRSESGDILESYGERVAAKTGAATGGPLADATSPGTLRVGEAGRFSAAYSTGGGRSLEGYEWVFGDGTTATGETVRHRFDEPGAYEVELTVTDEAGASATDTETVTVVELPEDSILVEGAGEGLFDDLAEFHVASRVASGSITLEAQVASMSSTDPDAQAGIVALEDLDADGAVGGVAVTPSAGTEIVRAFDETTPTWRERRYDDHAPPLWLRLEYADGVMTGLFSTDGEEWTEIETGEVALGDEFYVGLFVSANAPSELCTVQFDGVDWLESFASTDVGAVEIAGHALSGTGEGGGGGEPADLDVTGDGNPAQDLTGDGLYEDVTGDGHLGFNDVVTFFEEHTGDVVQGNVERFDFSGNDQVGFTDVVALFERL
ncbi:PKD domain-containing protein [Natronobiforma cellulositropha]|uniref:PKD domain-containing protein n=1 Tax=Natronobiforma cellulositropha TaxID=1679076 RepID=UPI0021D58036|nr:PKD domain-containing protein [Natronobiforma cellulositropha]